ncbi:MAG: hypothetical protein Q9222_002733 [Ikaeria aurantiellina]
MAPTRSSRVTRQKRSPTHHRRRSSHSAQGNSHPYLHDSVLQRLRSSRKPAALNRNLDPRQYDLFTPYEIIDQSVPEQTPPPTAKDDAEDSSDSYAGTREHRDPSSEESLSEPPPEDPSSDDENLDSSSEMSDDEEDIVSVKTESDSETNLESQSDSEHLATRKANCTQTNLRTRPARPDVSRRHPDAPRMSKLRARILRMASEGKDLDPNGSLKGTTRIKNGQLEYLDCSTWIPAVYHEELRAQLLREARLLGSYDEQPAKGGHRLDRTAYKPEQKSWKFLVREERPDALFLWDSPENHPTYMPEIWFDNGRIVLSQDNHGVRLWHELPTTISGQCEGLRMETWRRINPNITMNDIKARMPRLTRKQPHLAQKVVKTTALANRMQRDRMFIVAKAWYAREGSNIKETRTFELIPPKTQLEIVKSNSTRCVQRDMTRDEVSYIEEGNRGTAISLAKAGARRLNEKARQQNLSKIRIKSFDSLRLFGIHKKVKAAMEKAQLHKPKSAYRPRQARSSVRHMASRNIKQEGDDSSDDLKILDGASSRIKRSFEGDDTDVEDTIRVVPCDDDTEEDDPPHTRTIGRVIKRRRRRYSPVHHRSSDIGATNLGPSTRRRGLVDGDGNPIPSLYGSPELKFDEDDPLPLLRRNDGFSSAGRAYPTEPAPLDGPDVNGHYAHQYNAPITNMHARGHRGFDASQHGMHGYQPSYPGYGAYAPTMPANDAHPWGLATGNYRQGTNQGMETAGYYQQDWEDEMRFDGNGLPIPGYGGLNDFAYW